MKSELFADTHYLAFVADLKTRIQDARIAAARTVNQHLILLYWDIGQGIVERQTRFGWGESVVKVLARDLQSTFPHTQGFSVQNLWRMRQFYMVHTEPDFLAEAAREGAISRGANAISNLSQPVRDLEQGALTEDQREILSQAVREFVARVPWGHHVNLLTKVKNQKARLYYLRATAQFGWSRDVLLNQIKADAYERSLKEGKTHNFNLALPEYLAEQAEESLKSSYNLEFLGIARPIKERELEQRLIERVQQFMLELGYGFCFIGRQHCLTLGPKEYFIDLLFYHRFLKALVAVELKTGAFEPEYAGKMDFYLNVLNEQERAPDDNPSIGIILCAEKENLEVEFSLRLRQNSGQMKRRKVTDFEFSYATPIIADNWTNLSLCMRRLACKDSDFRRHERGRKWWRTSSKAQQNCDAESKDLKPRMG
jgi:predicted nuclease of restriction endonuclease-like (RecB) superfamily